MKKSDDKAPGKQINKKESEGCTVSSINQPEKKEMAKAAQSSADSAGQPMVSHVPDTRFKPGSSGNPSGRPKRTPAEAKALAQIRKLAPEAAKTMKEMLQNVKTPAAVRVKICEIILDRTYGKAPASISLSTDSDKVEESRSYILSLVRRIRGDDSSDTAVSHTSTNPSTSPKVNVSNYPSSPDSPSSEADHSESCSEEDDQHTSV